MSRYRWALCLGASLGTIVDADEAEALVTAVEPLEIIRERPDELAAHVGASLAGPGHGGDVLGEAGSAVVVADEAGLVRLVVEGGPVLGDHPGEAGVAAGQDHQPGKAVDAEDAERA